MNDTLDFDAVRSAERLYEAHLAFDRFTPFAASEGILDLKQAYEVQDAFVDMVVRRRKTERAGYKIGLTSKVMQQMCGIDEPVAGVILADRVHSSGARLSAVDFGRIGLEFEIAVFLGEDLDSPDPVSIDDVFRATSHVCAAIELVDDRGCDYATLDARSLVADNSWNAGVILGRPVHDAPELADVFGVIHANGAEIGSGYGREALGHPFNSVAWLANNLRGRGQHLRAGDFVMTGSLIRTQFPTEATAYDFSVTSLGDVECNVEAE